MNDIVATDSMSQEGASEEQSPALDKALGKIKTGWIAGLASAVLTLGVTLLAINSTDSSEFLALFDVWTLVDVALILGLVYGIYRKNRGAATFMFLYFLASKIWMIVETGRPQGMIMSLLFLYFYFQAMVGTFQYHKLSSTT